MSPRSRHADALVIFGITGDLARKMTFRSLYRLESRGLLNVPIIGVAVDDWDVEQLRERARESIEATEDSVDAAVFKRLADRMSYVSGDFGREQTYRDVAQALGEAKNPAFYLEVPPSLFETVIAGLAKELAAQPWPASHGREALWPRLRLGARSLRAPAPVPR